MQAKHQRNAYFLAWSLGPLFIFLTAVFLGPFVYMLWLSFTDLSFAAPDRTGNFMGLDNYSRALWHDEVFLGSLARSAIFTLLSVSPEILIGIIVAEILYTRPIAQRLLSPLFALPVLLPTVVVGLYWRIMLQGEFGVVSYYLAELGLPAAKGILSNSHTILITLALVDIWQWTPFVALVLLAGRSSLPRAPLEAALLDGASQLRAFVDVTLPGMLPTVIVIGLIRAVDSFKEFDKVFILTGGGPGNASELSSIYAWRVAFRRWDFGYAAAICVLIYLLLYAVSQGVLSKIHVGARR